jgi:hypothetical protein
VRRFLPFLLCLSLSAFTTVRAMSPAHASAQDAENKKVSAGALGQGNRLFDDETGEDTGSDYDDSMEGASNDDGEDMNEDDHGNAAGSEDTGVDDAGADDADDSGDEEWTQGTPR